MTLARYCKFTLLILSMVMAASCGSPPVSHIKLNNLDLKVIEVVQKTPLILAAERGDSVQVKRLLEQGALINTVAPEGTAFSVAVKQGHRVISRFLLSAGADWRSGFKPGEPTALMLAAEQANDILVKELIVRGAELNTMDDQGYSALAKAAKKGHLTTMKIIVNAGADVNVAPEGRSLLMHVVADNNILLSQLLIAAGANVDYRDETGDTALKVARRNGYFDIDLMLVQAGARP